VPGGIAVQYGWKSDTVRLVDVLVSLFSAGFPRSADIRGLVGGGPRERMSLRDRARSSNADSDADADADAGKAIGL
jgi:hypothetical protein